jgi:uncharacterized protein YjiS (DUF1127 family)
MAHSVSASHGLFTSAVEGLFDLIKDAKASYARHKAIQSTIKELNKLSNRELNDIGIARGDIWAIAHEDTDFKRFAQTNSNLKGWV